MKKKLFWMFAAILTFCGAFMLTSCDEDDTNGPDNQVKKGITFNTAAIYDELGITEKMNKLLSDTLYSIIDSVLVYDQAGALVSKFGMETTTLGDQTLAVDGLPDGTYTLVLWQTARRISSGYIGWTVYNEEQLDSVSLYMGHSLLNYQRALGYASATATVAGNSLALKMEPKNVGCLVEVNVDNLTEDKGYKHVAICNHSDRFGGIYLNPSKEDRWMLDNQYIEVVSRNYPGEARTTLYYSLMHGDNINMIVRGDKEGSYDEIGIIPHRKIIPGERYTAYIDVENSSWLPTYFGTGEDYAAWKAERESEILPFIHYVDWDCTASDVATHMRSNPWVFQNMDNLGAGNGFWYLPFWVTGQMYQCYYFGDEEGTKLNFIFSGCHDPKVPIEKARQYVLKQGYIYSGKIQFPDEAAPRDLYFSADNKTEVLIGNWDEKGWEISYQPTDPNDMQYIVGS